LHGLRDNKEHKFHWISRISIQGPWLADTKPENDEGNEEIREMFFPAPANLYRFKKNKETILKLLHPLSEEIPIPGWNRPLEDYARMRPLLYLGNELNIEPANGYLTLAGLKSVLQGKPPSTEQWIPQEKIETLLYAFDNRTGNSIDPETYATKKGQIYSASHLSLPFRMGFYMEIGWEVDDSSLKDEIIKQAFPKSGVTLSFGGESRRVLVKSIDNHIQWDSLLQDSELSEDGFTTHLISPVIFYAKSGTDRKIWQPPQIADLISAAVPKPLAISGWNLTGTENSNYKEHPKPTRSGVPAGAVYFWKHGKNAPEDRTDLPFLCQLAERPIERAAGWGIALKGVWKYDE